MAKNSSCTNLYIKMLLDHFATNMQISITLQEIAIEIRFLNSKKSIKLCMQTWRLLLSQSLNYIGSALLVGTANILQSLCPTRPYIDMPLYNVYNCVSVK